LTGDDNDNEDDDDKGSNSRYLALQASKIEFLSYFADDDSRRLIAEVERQVMPYKPVGHVFEPSKSVLRKARSMMLGKVSTKWEKYLRYKQLLEEVGSVVSDTDMQNIQDDVLQFIVKAEIESVWWQPLSTYLYQQQK